MNNDKIFNLKLLLVINRFLKHFFTNGRISGWSPYQELSLKSEAEGRAIRRQWLIEQGRRSYNFMLKQSLSIKGLSVLDVGCGDGYKTWYYAMQEPTQLVGADIDLYRIKLGHNFKLDRTILGPEFAGASLSSLPFQKEIFDICLMDDVMEHTQDPDKSLKEVRRVVKNYGLVYITFTSFNAAQGGHMSDWIQIPWVHFFFSEKVLSRALLRIYNANPNPYILRQFRGLREQTPGFVFADLNKMTARKFCKIAKTQGFEVEYLAFSSFLENPLLNFILNRILHYAISDYFSRRVICILRKIPS